MFGFIVFIASIGAAICAAIAGFGIGSILSPLLSLSLGTKTAVALVSIPHFLATALRFWFVRRDVDWKLFRVFGLTSALGSLLGAVLFTMFQSRILAVTLAVLMIFVGVMGILGKLEKMKVPQKFAQLAGFVSGIFGGLVGNQGGVRSAALLGFNVPKKNFVATATAIGLIVDGARMPVYFFQQSTAVFQSSFWLILTSIGVVIGTVVGYWLFNPIPEKAFKYFVSYGIIALGVFMLIKGS